MLDISGIMELLVMKKSILENYRVRNMCILLQIAYVASKYRQG